MYRYGGLLVSIMSAAKMLSTANLNYAPFKGAAGFASENIFFLFLRRCHFVCFYFKSSTFSMAAGNDYCYFPNGDLSGVDSPCFPDEEVSPCCGLQGGWTCLTNGLCHNEILKQIGRGTCTDSNWDSPSCPQYCTRSSYEFDEHFSSVSLGYNRPANNH